MSDKEIGLVLDLLCLIATVTTTTYIYRLRRIVGGGTITLLLVGFGINVAFRLGYMMGYNMHPYFILSYIFVASGFVSLFHQVRSVIHSPIREARKIFVHAEEVYKKAEEAHRRAGDVMARARETFDAVGAVNAEIKKIYFTEEK
jgi:hypothetical protein